MLEPRREALENREQNRHNLILKSLGLYSAGARTQGNSSKETEAVLTLASGYLYSSRDIKSASWFQIPPTSTVIVALRQGGQIGNT